jgi:hypothetical protein
MFVFFIYISVRRLRPPVPMDADDTGMDHVPRRVSVRLQVARARIADDTAARRDDGPS